jgi:small-conductance mechanosensitive channel
VRAALLPLLFIVAWLAAPASATAQGAAPTAPVHEPAVDVRAAEEARPAVPVSIDGRELFRVAGVSGYPAEERARVIEERLHRFARADRPVEELHAQRMEHYTLIAAGDDRIAAVHQVDAQFEGIDRDTLAEINLRRMREAIERYRAERDPRHLLQQTGYALLGTLLLVVVLAGVHWSERRLKHAIELRSARLLADLEGKSKSLVRAHWITAGLRVIVGAIATIAIIIAALAWLGFVLELFPWTRPLGERVISLFVGPLTELGRGIVESVPGIAFLVVLYFVTRAFLRFIRLAFNAVQSGNVQFESFDPDWAEPTYKIVRLLVVIFALVVAYPYVPGSGSEAFKGISLMLGVMFSLGSSSIISNLIAGYSMTYRRAFRKGDMIKVGDDIGRVVDVRLQVTHLRNMKNEEVIIPNSQILGSSVTNFSSLSRAQGLFISTTVGIGYETPWRQVESMLLFAAERTAGVRRDPAPFVLEKSLGDFCVVYELFAAIDDPVQRLAMYALLHRNVLDVFNEYGVQIMTPAYEGDPEQPKVVPREQWYTAPARVAPADAAASNRSPSSQPEAE